MVKRSAGELLFAIAVDRSLDKSITTQVYAAVRQLITSGALPSGKRLPSSRTLAKELDISRTTALSVFERLTAEGLIVSRTGSGSYVSDLAETSKPAQPLAASPPSAPSSTRLADIISDASPRFFQRLAHPHRPRAFITGLPDYDAFPLAIWARLTAKHWREPRELIMGYSDAHGHPRLRAAIAEHLRANRGVSCDTEQIFIVNGAQQAFDLIGRVLLNPGLVRESGRHRRAQQPDRLRRTHGAGAGRPGRHIRRRRAAPGAGFPPRLRDAVAPASDGRRDEPSAA